MIKCNKTELQSHRSKSVLTRNELNKKIINRLNKNNKDKENEKSRKTIQVSI
jgi:hypothetical protein